MFKTAVFVIAAALALYAHFTGMDFYKGFFLVLVGTPVALVVIVAAVLALGHLAMLFDGSWKSSEPKPRVHVPLSKHLKDFGTGFTILPLALLTLGPIAFLVPPAGIVAFSFLGGVLGLHFLLEWGWVLSILTAFGGANAFLGFFWVILGWRDPK